MQHFNRHTFLIAIGILTLLGVAIVWAVPAGGGPRGETVDLYQVTCRTDGDFVRLNDAYKAYLDNSGRRVRFVTVDNTALNVPPEALCMENPNGRRACMKDGELVRRGRCRKDKDGAGD